MARYCIDLYFDKKLSRQELIGRITSIAGCRAVPDEPDTYTFDQVHISLAELPHSQTPAEIRHATGLEVPAYHLEVYVHSAADEAFQERWDRVLDLLAGGEDAVAIHESECILHVQKNGQLTLDNTGETLSPHYRDYILRKRPAQQARLGILT